MIKSAFAPVFFLGLASLSVTAADESWQPLFDGRSLDGWRANESPQSWVVEDGALVTRGPRSHLFYVGPVANHTFRNFEFSAEVMTTPGSNSGIYFHTQFSPEPWPPAGYEAQVLNSSRQMEGGYVERKMTGSIYAVRNTWRAPAQDNTWFEYRIKVSGKTIQTFINGALVCQYTEPPQPWRASDKQGRRLSSGTFALQAHDPDSVVRYRNLRVRRLPDDAPSLEEPPADAELDALISQFSDANLVLIDLGIVRGSVELELAQLAAARRYGVTIGYTLPTGAVDLAQGGATGPVLLINDREKPPAVDLLRAAAEQGATIAFSSGGVMQLDPERLKRRLRAVRDAGLGWEDLWWPGM